mmetsp:Transcript_19604/g.49068  ORF Transcript_19604/g.49068 Transcript_19604/m.49068 type:complete len:218 (-) Transcript_19604:1936-2589(-)
MMAWDGMGHRHRHYSWLMVSFFLRSCRLSRPAYVPPSSATSSSCVPLSHTTPPAMTLMRLAWRTVLRRCATTTAVWPPMAIRRSSASCTAASLSRSSALVASSSSSSCGLRRKTRAMARRWRCPPLSRTPRSPSRVSYPSGKVLMKSCALAARAAASISSGDASGASSSYPYPMLPLMVWLKICMSCITSPMCLCTEPRFSSRRSAPSNAMEPALTS